MGIVFVWCVAGALLCTLARGAPAKYEEYEVKAAFLYKFIHFVRWPDRVLETLEEEAAFGIGILGKDPFGNTLDQLVRGKKRDARPVRIFRGREFSELSECFVLFIAKSETDRVGRLLDLTREKPVLTVSEIPGFAKKGGIIELYVKEKNVRFRINAEAARAKGLKIHANLLELAEVVGPKPKGEQQ